jgi:hypothetical protein
LDFSSKLNVAYVKQYVNKNVAFMKDFLYTLVMPIIKNMEGLTVAEISEELGIPDGTVRVRLSRAGIKPITQSPLYDKSALEAIRDVPGKGRPRKPKPDI